MSGPNHPRGTTNTNKRGSAASRRARKQWLLDTFGDGEKCNCSMCGCELTFATLTVDRFPIPGMAGGTYHKSNIRPACQHCQSIHGNEIREAHRRLAEIGILPVGWDEGEAASA